MIEQQIVSDCWMAMRKAVRKAYDKGEDHAECVVRTKDGVIDIYMWPHLINANISHRSNRDLFNIREAIEYCTTWNDEWARAYHNEEAAYEAEVDYSEDD